MPQWKPDADFHDTGKANGIDFPSHRPLQQISQFKDIEGMDPLQIPLWKFLYQGLNNTWLRRMLTDETSTSCPSTTSGRPSSSPELVQQLKSRNLDLDRFGRLQMQTTRRLSPAEGGDPTHG